MNIKLIIFALVIFSSVPFVNAQYFYDETFGSAFQFPFLDLTSIVDFYSSNSAWLDFFIILALMIGILNMTLEKKLGAHTPIVLSLILSFGFVALERQLGFTLGDFGAVAGLVFALALLMVVLMLMKKIFEKFSEHGSASKTGAILFLIAAVIAAVYFLNDSGTFSSLSSIIPSGTQLLGFILFALIIGALAVFFFLKTHTETEKPAPGTPESASLFSFFPSFFQKSEEKKDYSKARQFVIEIEKLAKNPEIAEDIFNNQYRSAEANIALLVEKYKANPDYLGAYTKLQQDLRKTKLIYEESQKKSDIRKNEEALAVDLQKTINALNRDINDDRYPLATLEAKYNEAETFYEAHKNNLIYGASISSSLKKLEQIITQKKNNQIQLDLEPVAKKQIEDLKKTISELESYAEGKKISEFDKAKLQEYNTKFQEYYTAYINQLKIFNEQTSKSLRNKEIKSLLDNLATLTNYKGSESRAIDQKDIEENAPRQYAMLSAIFKSLKGENLAEEYPEYTSLQNLSYIDLYNQYKSHKSFFENNTQYSVNTDLVKKIRVLLTQFPLEIEARRIIEGLREINGNFFNLSHEEDLRKGFLSKLFFKNSLAKYGWNNMDEAYSWSISFFVKHKKNLYQKTELYDEIKKLYSGLKSRKTKPATTPTTSTEAKEKTGFFGNIFGKSFGSRFSWLGKITDAEINKKISALENLLSNPATTKADLEKAQVEAAIFFGKVKNYIQEHPELEKKVIEIMEKIAVKLSTSNSEKPILEEEFIELDGDPAEVRKDINSFFNYLDKIIRDRTVSELELNKALRAMNAFPIRYREYLDDEIKARYKELVYRFNRKWGEEIEQLTITEKKEAKLEAPKKEEEPKILDQINTAFNNAGRLLSYDYPKEEDLKKAYEQIQKFKDYISKNEDLQRRYFNLLKGFQTHGIVRYR